MSSIGRNICDIISGSNVGDRESENCLVCNDHQKSELE